MHIGKSYKLSEFLDWTRRDIYVLIALGIAPVVAYQIGDLKWLGIPWTVVALLGTATAFIVGFKNVQTYNRTWEARQISSASFVDMALRATPEDNSFPVWKIGDCWERFASIVHLLVATWTDGQAAQQAQLATASCGLGSASGGCSLEENSSWQPAEQKK